MYMESASGNRRPPELKELTMRALGNLLNANIEAGFAHFIKAGGYHGDEDIRATFLNVMNGTLKQVQSLSFPIIFSYITPSLLLYTSSLLLYTYRIGDSTFLLLYPLLPSYIHTPGPRVQRPRVDGWYSEHEGVGLGQSQWIVSEHRWPTRPCVVFAPGRIPRRRCQPLDHHIGHWSPG